MGVILKMVDEHFGKGRDDPFELHLASERVTARELISRRISDEIVMINRKSKELRDNHDRTRSFLIRLDPSSPEAMLNASVSSRRTVTSLDIDTEKAAAETAFMSNQFIMLFDDRQLGDLDEEIVVKPASEVVFLRLVPLVGG